MNNRLGDIPAWALEDSDEDDTNRSGDIEMAEQNKPQYMEIFFREVDGIKKDIDAISRAAKDIGKINEQAMRATTTAEEQKLSKKLKPLIDSTNKRARQTKTLLGLLKEETDKLKKGKKINPSDTRWVCEKRELLHFWNSFMLQP